MRTLLEKIGMPEEVTEAVLKTDTGLTEEETNYYCGLLRDKDRYEEAYAPLQERLQEDGRGLKMLAVMLRAALEARAEYQRRGIPDAVYYDTMECFARFVKEHFESFGYYAFDRGFWTGHQLSLVLFRLGSLEYEITPCGDVYIHIPSRADLSERALDLSIARAKAFFQEQKIAVRNYCCISWLLSPELRALLPASSKILIFQNMFDITPTKEGADDYKLWLFKNKALSPEEFPEDTSLQRRVKQYVLAGGKIYEGKGVLKL